MLKLLNLQIVRLGKKSLTKLKLRHVSDAVFEKSVKALANLKEEPSSEVKLRLYALYKQVREGPCKQVPPSMINFTAVAKYNAWKSLATMNSVRWKLSFNKNSKSYFLKGNSQRELCQIGGKIEWESFAGYCGATYY